MTQDSTLELELDRPLDMHLHLRDGAMLDLVAPLSAQTFAGAVIMPNLVPAGAALQAFLDLRRTPRPAGAGPAGGR